MGELSKYKQYLLTIVLVVLAGSPFAPSTNYNDQVLMGLLHTHPWQAVSLMALSIVVSTTLFWFMMANVLDPIRFRHSVVPTSAKAPMLGNKLTDPLLKNDSLADQHLSPQSMTDTEVALLRTQLAELQQKLIERDQQLQEALTPRTMEKMTPRALMTQIEQLSEHPIAGA